MSEERKLVLQMVAEGKISPDEADMLLQAIADSERAAQSAAAEDVRGEARNTEPRSDLRRIIERAVRESLKGLDQTLRHLESGLQLKLNDQKLRTSIEDRLRRSAEQAVERARGIEARAARVVGRPFIKVGVAIDRETVEQNESLQFPAQPGDRLVVENRVGDITVEFHEGSEFLVDVRKLVWGEDKADATARAAATTIELRRNGSDVQAAIVRPRIAGAGVLILKDTRVDFTVKAPRGAHLKLQTKVGDIRIKGTEGMGDWTIGTQVGDVDVLVTAGTGFRYTARSKLGDVLVDLPAYGNRSPDSAGAVGDGKGSISAIVKIGDVRIHSA